MNGRLFRIVSQLHGDTYEPEIFSGVKLASKDDGSKAKDLGIMLGGSTLGALGAYGLTKAVKNNYGSTIAKIDPKDRLKYIIPALSLLGTGTMIAKLQQNNYTKNEKTASHYLVQR